MNGKTNKGLSLLELLIALALFSVSIAAILPLLLQGSRNMQFAESYYRGHLAANRLLHVIKDAVTDGENVQVAVVNYAEYRGIEFFTVLAMSDELHHFSSYGSPVSDIVVANDLSCCSIVVLIWCGYGNLIGRAFASY